MTSARAETSRPTYYPEWDRTSFVFGMVVIYVMVTSWWWTMAKLQVMKEKIQGNKRTEEAQRSFACPHQGPHIRQEHREQEEPWQLIQTDKVVEDKKTQTEDEEEPSSSSTRKREVKKVKVDHLIQRKGQKMYQMPDSDVLHFSGCHYLKEEKQQERGHMCKICSGKA